MKHITAVIIDDEPDSIALLQLQLQKHCPHITVLHTFTSSPAAADELLLIKPDIVFLDIEMPDLDGFQLLEKLSPVGFRVIFITAYNQYAIKAFRFNALDYLVKPVATEELVTAVEKAAIAAVPLNEQLEQAKQQIKGAPVNKIAVSAHSGVIFIEFNDILYAEASGNYSKLIMSDESHFIISKTLKDIQEVLEEKNFFRIHRQYIINLNKVKHFNRVDALLTMENKAELPVARTQKDRLAECFDWL